LYGIELEEEDLEEIALVAWDLIGNKRTKLYSYTTCIDNNNSIQLPCNASSVESLTVPYEDWNRVTNHTENGDYRTSIIESRIEAEK